MSDIDVVSLSEVSAGSYAPGTIVFPTDSNHAPRYRGARVNPAATETPLLEPFDHTISAWCVGDGTTTTFTIGAIPDECLVREVSVIVSGTAGTATTTLAVGIAGTTGKYMSASSFTDSMNAAGVKTVTTIPIHETTARTVIATFSAAWDSGAKALVAVRYIKLPNVPA